MTKILDIISINRYK